MAVLPDVLAPGLDIIFCGTAVGEKSARLQAYYAGRGNAFWPTLYRAGLTGHQIKPQDFHHILRWKMGLTDLVKEVFGNDGCLSADRFDRRRLDRLVVENYPRILAFTSKRAAKEFFGKLSTMAWQKLPSTKPSSSFFPRLRGRPDAIGM